jgi:hypothetical protein
VSSVFCNHHHHASLTRDAIPLTANYTRIYYARTHRSHCPQVRRLAIKFFSKTMTTDLSKMKAVDSKVTTTLISFATREPNADDESQSDSSGGDRELVALLAAYLGTVCKSATHAMAARTEASVLIGLARTHITRRGMLCTWLALFGTMCDNSLGTFEVVRAGVIPLLFESITTHADSVEVARGFLRVLAAVTSEPAHAEAAFETPGLSKAVFECMRTHETDPDCMLLAMRTVANGAAVLSLHRTIVADGAAEVFAKALRAKLQRGTLQAEAFRMANGLAQDPTLLPKVTPQTTTLVHNVTCAYRLSNRLPCPYSSKRVPTQSFSCTLTTTATACPTHLAAVRANTTHPSPPGSYTRTILPPVFLPT